jgi:hypothetical protein
MIITLAGYPAHHVRTPFFSPLPFIFAEISPGYPDPAHEIRTAALPAPKNIYSEKQ